MRYFEHSASHIDLMLKSINKESLDELFSSIPADNRLKRKLDLPEAIDELRLKRLLTPFLTPPPFKSFLGAGACAHFVPEWVSQQLLRAEWYTSYTPYQPEISQGTLQAIFEFQSMVASLFGLSVANASLYDGATALVEALLMATRLTQKKTVLIAQSIHPEYRETLKTYAGFCDITVKVAPFRRDGTVDQAQLLALVKECGDDLAAIAVGSPNFFGVLEDLKPVAARAHEHQALLVGVTTDMSSCALMRSFGEVGADIAVGEGLGFLPGLNAGGPGVGLLATKKEFVRQMPGRLVGFGEDAHKNPGYVLTLSGREQHIRREKATSNICTNHNLMALAFAMSMAAYGASGLRKLALMNLKKTLYFRQCLKKVGLSIAFGAPHYNETVIDVGNEALLEKRLAEARRHELLAGLKLSPFYPALAGHLLVCTTELHEDASIELLAQILSGHHD